MWYESLSVGKKTKEVVTMIICSNCSQTFNDDSTITCSINTCPRCEPDTVKGDNKMERYIGTKVIEAKPMNRRQYNDLRGWVIPADENPHDDGYLVKYEDGYISWSPKSTFESAYRKTGSLTELKHDLLTTKYTRVLHEKEFKFNAPHHFEVYADAGQQVPYLVGNVHFQEGPIKENGVNGVCNEDLIAMVICRLEHFNQSEFRCRENSMAVTKLEEALLWLRKRTMGREQRGVEGTNVK